MPALGDRAPALAALGAGPDPAVTGPAGTLSHAALRRRIERYAEGCTPGQRVAVASTDPVEVLVAVLGANAAGACPVVADPTWPAQRLRAALRLAGAGTPQPGQAPVPGWIGFTSGSAGTPRPIARSAASWVESFPRVSTLASGLGAGDRVLVGAPLTSSLFLFGALHALWAGAHVLAPGRWDPGRLPAADLAHCVPPMLDDLTVAPAPPGRVICAGAALPGRVADAAAARGIRVLEYYGATELSFVAWRREDGRLTPFPGVELELRHGEIWVRSRYLATGYAAPEVTGPLRRDARGFATVGDLGRLAPDGGLTVLGRADGTILTGGSPVLPTDVESVLAGVPGVRDVVVTGTPHPRIGAVVTAFVEPVPGAAPGLAALRAAAGAGLAGPQRPRHWYLVPALPRTAAGKPVRAGLVEALAAGALAARRLT